MIGKDPLRVLTCTGIQKKKLSQSFTKPKNPLPSPSSKQDIPVPTPTKDTLNMVIRYTPQKEIFKKINDNLKIIERNFILTSLLLSAWPINRTQIF